MCSIPTEPNLELNIKSPKYKIFYGHIRETIPQLISEGRLPITVKEILEERLNVLEKNASKKVVDSWWNHRLYTGDITVYNPNGALKIVKNPQFLLRLEPKRATEDYDLILSNNKEEAQTIYEKMKGIEFTHEEVLDLRENHWSKTKKVFMNNPIWKELVNSQELLGKYYDTVSALEKSNASIPQMGLYTHPAKDYEVRPITVNCIDDCSGGLDTYFPADFNQLIGVYR